MPDVGEHAIDVEARQSGTPSHEPIRNLARYSQQRELISDGRTGSSVALAGVPDPPGFDGLVSADAGGAGEFTDLAADVVLIGLCAYADVRYSVR